eukprot:1939314-Rhodomonas_salina.2
MLCGGIPSWSKLYLIVLPRAPVQGSDPRQKQLVWVGVESNTSELKPDPSTENLRAASMRANGGDSPLRKAQTVGVTTTPDLPCKTPHHNKRHALALTHRTAASASVDFGSQQPGSRKNLSEGAAGDSSTGGRQPQAWLEVGNVQVAGDAPAGLDSATMLASGLAVSDSKS